MIQGRLGKQIAVINGGGDAPGLNAVIRAITIRAISLGYDVLGFRDGWAGLLDKGEIHPLDLDNVDNIHILGGTILRTSRTNPYKTSDGPKQVIKNLKKNNCEFLIAIGGEDTLGVANKLYKDGVKVVGVPKTIDNDLSATDFTFGFDTAVTRATEAIQNLHTTAESHHRVIVVEVMGRHAGWITLYAGIAGGANYILIPEEKFDIKAICKMIKDREKRKRFYSIIACSEGAIPIDSDNFMTSKKQVDDFGHIYLGGIAENLAKEIEKRIGKETRHVVLGHLQRAGSPTPFDRVLGTRLGIKAVDLINEGKFGKMASLKGAEIKDVNLSEAVEKIKTVPKELFENAKLFFG